MKRKVSVTNFSSENNLLMFRLNAPVVFLPVHFRTEYEYLNVLDQNADSRDTLQDVLAHLYQEFNNGYLRDHLVVTGDAKTYKHLQSLKLDYDQQLSWLIPFPGDFHILMNYQPILSKVYFDAGLKQVTSAGGGTNSSKKVLPLQTRPPFLHGVMGSLTSPHARCLFYAIRFGNWQLQLGALKLVAPLFS